MHVYDMIVNVHVLHVSVLGMMDHRQLSTYYMNCDYEFHVPMSL